MEKITFSKVYNYKTNDGRFCYINGADRNVYITVPECTTVFDVDYSTHRPQLVINTKGTNVLSLIESLKNQIVDHVSTNSKYIYGTTKPREIIEELYCSPVKRSLVKRTYIDTLKTKVCMNSQIPLPRGTKVSLKIHVSGLWFSADSYGPYLDVVELNILEACTPPKNIYMFVDEHSESEIEI
jgi:hypothetical protein